jgi:uncharacterized protein DUF2794
MPSLRRQPSTKEAMTQLIRIADRRHSGRHTYFSRREMDRILSLYSRRVMRGEWRDYALDLAPNMAVFSVFRHSQERALFSIAKRAEGTAGEARFFLFSGRERIMGGTSLDDVLAYFDAQLYRFP